MAGPVEKEETGAIGTVKWAIYVTATSRLLADGEKFLHARDVEIKRIKDSYRKRIQLGNHFRFGLFDNADRDKKANVGFGLTGDRDDEGTFSWEWFDVDRTGHAKKLQESGELFFDTKKTPNGTEINRMEFLTDVTIRVHRKGFFEMLNPAWRITIFKGSVVSWPVLVDGEAQSQ